MTAPLLRGCVNARHERFTLATELTLNRGERVAVIGRNGAGKSTLAQVLAGLIPASESTVELEGQPLRDVAPEHRRIGYLAQDALLFPHLDVLDNVAFAVRSRPGAARMSRAWARAAAREQLGEMGASALAASRVSELSGGERQRIALARTLAAEPKLLVLDEPFAALDVDAAARLRELVADRIVARGLSLLLISHNLVDVVRLTERAYVLENGQVAAELTAAELRRAPRHDFAASFAGLARLHGVVRRDAHGVVFISGDLTLRLPEVQRHGGIEWSGREGEAQCFATADEVELVDATAPDSPDTFVDRVVAVGGDGAAVVAELENGLRARVPVAAIVTPGEACRVRILSARIV